MLREALRQKRVEPAQSVEGVGDVNQARFHTPIQESAIDGFCCHDLAHISNVNRPGGGYASGDGVGARAFKLLGDDVSPVNRHEQGSTLEGNIKLPLRLMSFALSSLS